MQVHGVLVCLGNPGKEYENTRHNAGFLFSQYLRSMLSPSAIREIYTKKFAAHVYEVAFHERNILIIEPQSYMNLSGEPSAAVLRYAKIPLDRLILVHDELDLPLGQARWKLGGGDAGNKGVQSLTKHLGTNTYARLRIGIGRPPDDWQSAQGGEHGSAWVLGRFSSKEFEILDKVFKACHESLQLVLEESEPEGSLSFSQAQQQLHSCLQ